jgi:hypothetical protein
MDPIVVAAGTALVQAIATDGWKQVRDAVDGLWRRARSGGQPEDVSGDLEALRVEVLHARAAEDQDAEESLTGEWRSKLQRLLRADPDLAAALREVLDQVLTPALQPAQQERVQTILTGTASGHARLTQAGRDVNVVTGGQYNAGRDQTIHPRP